MPESRFAEIKRCLVRAEELGGTQIESPYDLYVADVRYLVTLVERATHNLSMCEEYLVNNVSIQDCLQDLEENK